MRYWHIKLTFECFHFCLDQHSVLTIIIIGLLVSNNPLLIISAVILLLIFSVMTLNLCIVKIFIVFLLKYIAT